MTAKSLRALGTHEKQTREHLQDLSLALYNNDKNFSHSHVVAETPPGYSGPEVSFAGSVYAKILANAFSFNVQDISDESGTRWDVSYVHEGRDFMEWQRVRNI